MAHSHVQVVAEIGSVHDGSFGNALELIRVAASVGADTVKFQLHIAQAESIRGAPNPPYFEREDRHTYFERTGFSREQWKALADAAHEEGISFMCSPFSGEALSILDSIALDALKVASGEVTNIPLLEEIGQRGLPTFLSTGMSDWAEIDAAVEVFRATNVELTILQCTSEYPCPPNRIGLNVLGEIQARYKLPVGLSDHSFGPAAAAAAAVLGASAIEKHLTFSREMYGSDAANAMEPDEFREMVRIIRDIETMLSHPVDKSDLEPYARMREVFSKSLVSTRPLRLGEVIDRGAVAMKKPGTGLPPSLLADVIGRRAAKDIDEDSLLSESDIEW